MADVILGGRFEMPDNTDRSAYVTSVTPSWDIEILESRPFNSGSGSAVAVAKDPGLENNSFTIHVVDDTSYTMTVYLESVVKTKVTFAIRPDDAAQSSSNPEWTGSAIVPRPNVAINQGGLAEYDVTFQVDGAVTFNAA